MSIHNLVLISMLLHRFSIKDEKNHVIFILWSINVVNYIKRFSGVGLLYSWDNSYAS